jgi:hypothetical protein
MELSRWRVPSFDILVAFTVGNCAEKEPQQHAKRREWMHWRNQECIHNEKAIDEVES